MIEAKELRVGNLVNDIWGDRLEIIEILKQRILDKNSINYTPIELLVPVDISEIICFEFGFENDANRDLIIQFENPCYRLKLIQSRC